jgi:hypothetical protein
LDIDDSCGEKRRAALLCGFAHSCFDAALCNSPKDVFPFRQPANQQIRTACSQPARPQHKMRLMRHDIVGKWRLIGMEKWIRNSLTAGMQMTRRDRNPHLEPYDDT